MKSESGICSSAMGSSHRYDAGSECVTSLVLAREADKVLCEQVLRQGYAWDEFRVQALVRRLRLTKRCSRPRQPYAVCQGQKFREAAAAAELGR